MMLVGGGAGSSMAIGMADGVSTLERSTFFVRCWVGGSIRRSISAPVFLDRWSSRWSAAALVTLPYISSSWIVPLMAVKSGRVASTAAAAGCPRRATNASPWGAHQGQIPAQSGTF